MEQLDEGAVKAIAELARQSKSEIFRVTLPSTVTGAPSEIPVIIDQSGIARSIYDLIAPWRQSPERKIGTARVHTLESFVELVDLHASTHSVIFADTDWTKPALTAVIDYHGPSDPDNGKHRVHYPFPVSEEWKSWLAIHGKPMKQVEFAEFVEDHIDDLAAPNRDEQADFEPKFGARVAHPNEIVELSRGLQINADVRIKNAVKLASGESQIVFEEDHKNAVGQPLSVPGVFILQIAPFFMGEPCRIPVRLRYRLREGQLHWTCQLYRPDRYITEQVRRDLEAAAEKTHLPKFEGSPEMSAT